jgi:hypothetical protein
MMGSGNIVLSLMIGPVVPTPVPSEVLDALSSVQVTTSSKGRSGFQLKFTISKQSALQTIFLLAGGASVPIVRVVIAVTVSGVTDVLIDGVITHQQVEPAVTTGYSTLTLTGEDLSRVMEYFDLSGIPYPAMPREARVALVVAKYAPLGIIPLVIPSLLIDVPLPIERIPRQKGNDLGYVQKLADDVGYTFYMDPGPSPGRSFAYWGPEIKVGVPQAALNVDMDSFTNVETLQFAFKPDDAKFPIVMYYNELSHIAIPIPVPPVTPLNPPLGAIPPIPTGLNLIPAANLSPIEVALLALKTASQAVDAVTGSGTLNVIRYGRPLKARKLVGVRGAGPAFDGLHYVTSVTHNIKPGEYKQSFTLSRNGLLSTIPQVPV